MALPACRILSTLRALSSLRSLARCARHTIMQACILVSVYLCVFGRVCRYLRVFARMCVYLHVFARICVYLRVFVCICGYLRVSASSCASLRLFACICAYLCIVARNSENHVKICPKTIPKRPPKSTKNDPKILSGRVPGRNLAFARFCYQFWLIWAVEPRFKNWPKITLKIMRESRAQKQA